MKTIMSILLVFLLSAVLASCQKKEVKDDDEGLKIYKVGNYYGFTGKVEGKSTNIDAQFNFAREFVEGYAVVRVDDKFGYINERGKYLAEPVYDMAYDFSEGFARVKRDKRYGYIDKTGKIAISLQYDDAADFKRGTAVVKITNVYYRIEPSGAFVREETNTNFNQKIQLY